jgi:hypothetical protein
LRLLLDEHYSARIAERLRDKEHDVVAATERPELVGLPDLELLRRMASERRAILTNNVQDFVPLLRGEAAGLDHYGLLFASDRSLPRSRGSIGLGVRVLDKLLTAHPAEDALRNQVRWLSP